MREFSLERNISFEGEGVEMFPMNEETSSYMMKMLVVISGLSILGVNIPIISSRQVVTAITRMSSSVGNTWPAGWTGR